MTETIIAKPVDQSFWILQANDQKIGNVIAEGGKYHVKINNQVTEFKSPAVIEKVTGIRLTQPTAPTKVNTIRGYSTGPEAFNEIWDVERGLPLFTKTSAGQCWYAAGWYRMKRSKGFRAVECPKLIYLQRYPYEGPFLTKGEAERG